MELFCQLIDGAFHRKQALGGTVAPVGTGGLAVGIHHIIGKAEGLQVGGIHGNGLVAGQTHGGGAMLAVSTGIGKGIQVNAPDNALLGGSQAHMHLHLMPGGGGNLALLPGVDHPGRAAGFPGHKGRVHLRHHRLLGTEAAADSGLFYMNHGLRDIQSVGNDPAAVEHDLGGADDMKPAVPVDFRIGAEGLHHGLLAGLHMIGMVNHHRAAVQYLVNVPFPLLTGGAEVPAVVCPHRAEGAPAVLGMNQYGVVLGGVEVQHRLQHLIVHPDELHSLVHSLFRFTCHNGDRIPHKPQVLIQQQPVIGRGLGIGLSCHGKPLLRYIPVGIDRHHPGNLHGVFRADFPDFRIGMGASQHLYHQSIPGRHILHKEGLPQKQLHGVLFSYRFTHAFQLSHWSCPPSS